MEKSFNQNINVQVQQVGEAPITLEITGFNGNILSGGQTGSMFSIFVNGTNPMTYNPGGPLTYADLDNGGTVYSTFSTNDNKVHSKVTLTRWNQPGGLIQGTFSGTAFDSTGDSMQITNGSFTVNRPKGADSSGLTQLTKDTISLTYDNTTYVWRTNYSDTSSGDLVLCNSQSAGGVSVTQISGVRMPGNYEMVNLSWKGPAEGSYTLGQEDVGTFAFNPSQTVSILALVGSSTDDNGDEHQINAPVTVSCSVSSGRVRGTFSGLVINSNDKCPCPTKGISGSFSIALKQSSD